MNIWMNLYKLYNEPLFDARFVKIVHLLGE